jgi:hypothetical protein
MTQLTIIISIIFLYLLFPRLLAGITDVTGLSQVYQ